MMRIPDFIETLDNLWIFGHTILLLAKSMGGNVTPINSR